MNLNAWSAVVLTAGSAMAFAQVPQGRVELPPSSIINHADPSHAYTTVMIHVPAEGLAPASAPGPTFETPASLGCVYKLVTPQVSGCPISGTTANPTGGARAIAVVDAFDNPNAAADLATYSAFFGLPAPNFQVVYATGQKPGVDSSGGWELEEALDIEMAHAMAPNAQIFLVEAKTNSSTDLYFAEKVAANMVAAAGGGEVTNSWGLGQELSNESQTDSTFSHPGVVFFASTGDATFELQYPAVSPNVVAVGGTSLQRSNGLFTSEIYWDNSLGGGGGGISRFENRPQYQQVISSIVGTKRGVPDVSADGDPFTGPAVYDSYPYQGQVLNWVQVGGTSASTPMWAGMVNAAGHFVQSTAAELNNMYKEYGNAQQYSQLFRDITAGASSCKTGWDICTGIGAPLTLRGK